jgi:ankyrin repeat protein
VCAAIYGHVDVARILIEHGASVHVDEDLPLRYACMLGYLDIVELLLENGAMSIHCLMECSISLDIISTTK